jgi:3D (Asp-Asp-Asp) domain-containing protein
MTGFTVEKFEKSRRVDASFVMSILKIALLIVLIACAIRLTVAAAAAIETIEARAATMPIPTQVNAETEELSPGTETESTQAVLSAGAFAPPAGASEDELVSLGEFKIYHYAPTGNRTATGTIPEVGRTIAVDPKVIPLGSRVIVDGYSYIAEDTGGDIKGNTLDVFVSTRAEALRLGVKYAEVFVLKGEAE